MNIKETILPWPDPETSHLEDPRFERIWSVIKRWDINVPQAYEGHYGATGSHVRAILDGLDGKSLGFQRPVTTDVFTYMIDNNIDGIDISSREDWKKQLEGKKGPIEFGEYLFHIFNNEGTGQIYVTRILIHG